MRTFFSLPNILTITRMLLAPVFILCLMRGGGYLLLGVVVFTIAVITDYYDGYCARKFGLLTKYGMFLDPLADKVLVLSTFAAFYAFSIIDLWMVVAIIIRDVIVTCLRMIAISKGEVFKTSMLAKWKTTSQFVLIYVVLALIAFYSLKGVGTVQSIVVGFYKFPLFMVLVHFVVGLTIYSGLHYLVINRKIIRKLFE